MLGIAEAAEAIGFKTVGVKIDLTRLAEEIQLPCILHWGQNHFVVLYKVVKTRSILNSGLLKDIWGGRRAGFDGEDDTLRAMDDRPKVANKLDHYVFHIADPGSLLVNYNEEEFKQKWLESNQGNSAEGVALLLEPTPAFYQESGEIQNRFRLRHMFDLVFKFKSLIIQLALGMLASSGLAVILPFLTQSVVDVGIATQDLSFIELVLIAQIALYAGMAAVEFLRGWILLHISTRLNLSILSQFLSKLMRLPVSFFEAKHFGDIMQRIGDHQRIESFLTGSTLNVIFSSLNLLIFSFVLAHYSMPIFLIAMLATLFYAGWVIIFWKQRRRLDAKRFEVSAQSHSQVIQLIQGMQEIKLSGSETSKRWEWEHLQAKLFKWSVKSLSLTQIQQAGTILINQGKNIFITFLTAREVIGGQLTLGELVSIQYILGQFNAPIEQAVGLLRSWQDAQMSMERLSEVHEMSDEEDRGQPKWERWSNEYDIIFSNVSFSYPGAGNQPVIQNLNLTIPYGKTTAIVGTSGSGKTTLLKLLLRFYECQDGSVSLGQPLYQASGQYEDRRDGSASFLDAEAGVALQHISHRAWRLQCGAVLQEGFIFSDTIARNIAVAEEIIDYGKLVQAAKVANIHEFIESLPLGYYTKIGAAGNGISQGQKQRVLIARAVYKNPKLLLFDEATNALDAHNEATIVSNLNDFLRGRTAVIVAHRLSTVKNADQIVVMEKGKIVEKGTHIQLVEKKGKYYQLVSNQLELAR
jgi:ATP-binding cassette subfamily B protein